MPLKLYILSYWGFGISKDNYWHLEKTKLLFVLKSYNISKCLIYPYKIYFKLTAILNLYILFLVNPLNKVWLFSQQNVNSKYSINFILS